MMSRVKSYAVVAVLSAVAAAFLVWAVKPEPAPRVVTEYVTRQALIELEPRLELGRIAGILWDALEVSSRQVAPQGGSDLVAVFCRPLVERKGPEPSPPVVSAPEPPLPREQALLTAGRLQPTWNPFRGPRLELFGVTNAGARFRDEYGLGLGPTEWGVDGDSTFARSRRLGVVRPVVTHGVATGIGVAIGLVVAAIQ